MSAHAQYIALTFAALGLFAGVLVLFLIAREDRK